MRRKRRGVAPIYIFALIWLGFTLFVPLLKLTAFLIGLGLALGGGIAAAVLIKRRIQEKEAAQARAAAGAQAAAPSAPTAEPAKPRYAPEVEAVIADGKLAMKELGRLYASIKNETVRAKINEIMSISDKIVADAIDDPADVPQIRKFLDFYLPTTLKLLNAYDRMDAQAIDGENITGSKKSIEAMLDTTIAAYGKQLDSLFANQALDIDSDIRAITGMMAREGLTGESSLNWKEFMKQYEQQKGTTQNG